MRMIFNLPAGKYKYNRNPGFAHLVSFFLGAFIIMLFWGSIIPKFWSFAPMLNYVECLGIVFAIGYLSDLIRGMVMSETIKVEQDF